MLPLTAGRQQYAQNIAPVLPPRERRRLQLPRGCTNRRRRADNLSASSATAQPCKCPAIGGDCFRQIVQRRPAAEPRRCRRSVTAQTDVWGRAITVQRKSRVFPKPVSCLHPGQPTRLVNSHCRALGANWQADKIEATVWQSRPPDSRRKPMCLPKSPSTKRVCGERQPPWSYSSTSLAKPAAASAVPVPARNQAERDTMTVADKGRPPRSRQRAKSLHRLIAAVRHRPSPHCRTTGCRVLLSRRTIARDARSRQGWVRPRPMSGERLVPNSLLGRRGV